MRLTVGVRLAVGCGLWSNAARGRVQWLGTACGQIAHGSQCGSLMATRGPPSPTSRCHQWLFDAHGSATPTALPEAHISKSRGLGLLVMTTSAGMLWRNQNSFLSLRPLGPRQRIKPAQAMCELADVSDLQTSVRAMGVQRWQLQAGAGCVRGPRDKGHGARPAAHQSIHAQCG